MIWAILKNLKYRGGRLGPRRGRRPEAVEAGPALSRPQPKPHPGPLEAEDGGVERPGGMPAESHKAPLHLQGPLATEMPDADRSSPPPPDPRHIPAVRSTFALHA